MGRADELRLITRVAQMYHVEGRKQADIAAALRISQGTVSRMLKRAEQEQIVRTTVIPPPGTFAELEQALRDRFGLTEAIVADCSEDRDSAVIDRIAEAAAHLLEVTLQPGEVIGVSSWSQTILRMVANIHPLRGGAAGQVVQLLGGMGAPAVQAQASELTARLARLTGGMPRPLLVQGVTASAQARDVMLADPGVQGTMSLFDRLSLAIIGIGAVEPSDLLARSGNVFAAQELAMLHQAGAVGEISFRFFDRDGAEVATPLQGRVIGITLDQLRRTGRVMALAGGPAKTAAIAGALRTGVIDVLVTDRFTAARLTAPG